MNNNKTCEVLMILRRKFYFIREPVCLFSANLIVAMEEASSSSAVSIDSANARTLAAASGQASTAQTTIGDLLSKYQVLYNSEKNISDRILDSLSSFDICLTPQDNKAAYTESPTQISESSSCADLSPDIGHFKSINATNSFNKITNSKCITDAISIF